MVDREPKYEIGTEFSLTYGGVRKYFTIVDILKTYNSKGEQVRLRYVTEHKLMGQAVRDYDVVETTIARALGAQALTTPGADR